MSEKRVQRQLPTLDPQFLQIAMQLMESDIEVDVEALNEPFDDELYKEREGGYGKTIQYVSAKHYRERLNDVLGNKWSFLVHSKNIIEEHSFRRYNKDDEDYEWLDGTPYVEVVGILMIPGLGMHMGIGVKKIQGDTASDALKAATTDALKKCCENFGIQVDYDDDEESASYNNNGGGGKKRDGDIDIEEVEYDEDDLEEANEVEITFGKYKGQTLEDVIEEDPDYIDWLYQNANEQDMADSAAIVYRAYLDAEEEKKNKRRGRGKSKKDEEKPSRGRGRSKKVEDDEPEEKPKRGSRGASSRKKDEADSGETEELIETIQEIFDDNEDVYDDVTVQSLIASVSVSKKFPQGKSSLEQLTVKELEKLAEVLAEDLEDEE